MKNRFFFLTLAGIYAIAVIAEYEAKNSTAEVEQMQGCYLFVDSKPVKEYEYLGTVKISIGLSVQYTGIRNALINRVKKEYPEANGIIFYFNSGGSDRCDAIRFKE